MVGAGPAGVAAAIELRRAGRDVVVVDKARFPRDKCCGDGLTTLALRELERLGLRPESVPSFSRVDGATLRSPSGRTVKVPLPVGPGVFAAVTPRIELDAALVDLASVAGIKVHQGHGVVDASSNDDHVRLGVDGIGTIRAAYVVAADGMWSPTRKCLGLSVNGYLGEWHAFRQYVGDISGPAANQLIVWFDADLLPGYAWSFPLPGGRANVGFGILRGSGRRTQEMKTLWAGLLDRPHIASALGPDASPEGRHLAWPIPACVDRATLAHGRVLFAGDAAAATDVMTGEGIGQALATGRLAAGAIIDASRSATDAGPRYARDVRRELAADHRMSVRLGRILGRRRGADAAVAVLARSGRRGRGNFARWMFEDEPRAIALTPRRWHRQFLGRPGAYADRLLDPDSHT